MLGFLYGIRNIYSFTADNTVPHFVLIVCANEEILIFDNLFCPNNAVFYVRFGALRVHLLIFFSAEMHST